MRVSVLLFTAFVFSFAQAAQDSADLARSVFQTEIKNQQNSFQPAATPGAVAVTEGTGGKTNTTPTTGSAPSQNTINKGASTGKSSQNMGAMINMAAGAALMAACFSHSPPRMSLCAMGAMALAQGAHDKGAAGKSGQTFDASQYDNGLSAPTEAAKGTGEYSNATVNKGLAALKDAGYTVTDAGVTSPDGTFTPSSAMGGSGMAAAFGADAVKEAQKVTAAINEEASKIASVSGVGLNSGGGGGAGGGTPEDENAGGVASEQNFGAGVGAAGMDRSRMMAGKTVNFDGEPIGVRGNNIFDMVHTAYQKKRGGGHFIESAGAVTATTAKAASKATARAPASIVPASVSRQKK